MTASVSLSTKIADLLFDTACLMIRKGLSRKNIRDDGIEGRVTTHFNEQVLGAMSGVEFFAEVETELGKGRVTFIVREADAKVRNLLEWLSFPSVEDLEEVLYPTPSRYAPAFN